MRSAPALADTTISTNTTQSGGTFTVNPAGALTIAGSPIPLLTITSSATTQGIEDVFIGAGSGSGGSLLIGAGSVFTNSGGTNLAGAAINSTGSATVTGTGSAWDVSQYMNVGGYGVGTLNIQNGGTVTTSTGYLGFNAGATGIATVSGAGAPGRIARS